MVMIAIKEMLTTAEGDEKTAMMSSKRGNATREAAGRRDNTLEYNITSKPGTVDMSIVANSNEYEHCPRVFPRP